MLLSDIIWSLSKRTPRYFPFYGKSSKATSNTSDTTRLHSFGQGRQQRLQGQVIVPLRKKLDAKAMFMSVMSISHMNLELSFHLQQNFCPHHRFCKTSSLSSRSIHECRMVQCRVPKSRWLPGVSENGDHGDP